MKTAYMYLDLREKLYFKNLLVIEMLLSQRGITDSRPVRAMY